MDMAEVKYCEKHPRVETNLRCGKCGELICPDCMVHTPVGVRCADCGRVRRIPTYDVSSQFIARGVMSGVLLGIASGALFVLVFRFLPQPVIEIIGFGTLRIVAALVVAGIGYGIGAGISLAVNRKRGKSLKFVAAGSVLVAYLIMARFGVNDISLPGLLGIAAAFYFAINRF